MDEIRIRITTRMLERVAFIFIILVLLVLLLFVWFRTPTCTDTIDDGATAPVAGNGDEPETNSTPPAVEDDPETCDDGKKNQDETDVDCGGDCGDCAEGKRCGLNADCAKGECRDGICDSSPKLSGTLTLSVKAVECSERPNTGNAVLNSVSLTVNNQLDKTLQADAEIYVKTSTGIHYLNQRTEDEARGDYKPYSVLDLPGIGSGQEMSNSYALPSSTLYSLTNKYEGGDDFMVEAQLIDKVTGSKLGQPARFKVKGSACS